MCFVGIFRRCRRGVGFLASAQREDSLCHTSRVQDKHNVLVSVLFNIVLYIFAFGFRFL